jgi:hypothetical protein
VRRLSKREGLTGLGLVLALSLTCGYLITRLPSVQKSLIFYEHRNLDIGWTPGHYKGGWGWAQRRHLHSPDLGPELLRDPAVVQQRHTQLSRSLYRPDRYAGEWALVFAGKRLLGMTNEQILSQEDGYTLTLATLVAEADPPAWWGRADWIGQQVAVKPQGSFRLGLLGPADVERLMARFSECSDQQLIGFVRCVLRHDDGFTPSQRDTVLEAWAKTQSKASDQNSVTSVQTALQVRQGLKDFLAELGPPGSEVALQVSFPDHTSALERKRLGWLLEDFVRSVGYRPHLVIADGQVATLVQLCPVNFELVTVDHFEQYTTTERVSHQEYSKHGGSRTVWQDRPVVKNKRNREIGAADIISLVVTAQNGNRAVTLVIPPYGEVIRDTQARIARYLADFSNVDRFYWSSYWDNDASQPWRYGLKAFRHEWELEDFP